VTSRKWSGHQCPQQKKEKKMTKEFIGLALGVVLEKLTPEQTAKANRALQHAQQKHINKIKKQRKRRK
jgi:hypothetical protein